MKLLQGPVLALCLVAPASAFDGWQGMRVIPLDGKAERIAIADLGHDGRDDVIVVNPRQARLDVYRWLPKSDRGRDDAHDPDRPNELPLAPEWSHGEIAIDELPVDAVPHDLDGDGRPELLVLTTPANRIAVYTQAADTKPDAKDAWKKTGEWNMLAGTPTGKAGCLLVRDLPGGEKGLPGGEKGLPGGEKGLPGGEKGLPGDEKGLQGGGHELLVGYEQGIQQLPLARGSRPRWLSPRENRGRLDWHLADLDGDGRRDLVEWSNVSRQVLRWYRCDSDGSLLPAQTIHDQNVDGFRSADPPAPGRIPKADLLLLGGNDKGVLRRHQLVRGEPSAIGRQDALPIPSALKRTWCGIDVGGKTAIVAVDSSQPRLRLHRLGDSGWLAEDSFPTIGGIRGLAAPAGDKGLLLVWTKDAADLHRCRWENGRLTYPQPWPQEGKDRKILALDSVGSTAWWAQRTGSDVDLFVWPAERSEPVKTRFPELGGKVEQVVWLGGDVLLVQDAYAAGGRLVKLVDGKSVVTTPSLLAKVDLSEYLLLPLGDELRKARLTDGVIQWLGDDLHPVDQVMLTEGQKIGGYLPVAAKEAWALEQGGGFIHRLSADDAGVMRVVESVKPPAGAALRGDCELGMVLVDQERIVRLAEGRPWELKLLESIDGRVGRRSGVSESTIHRILCTDLDGDGGDDAVLCDDRKHELTAMLRGTEGLKRAVSWKVFEDRKYPYDGGESKDMVAEPRQIAALDADGDGCQDLVMASQDRLVVYLGKDEEAP